MSATGVAAPTARVRSRAPGPAVAGGGLGGASGSGPAREDRPGRSAGLPDHPAGSAGSLAAAV